MKKPSGRPKGTLNKNHVNNINIHIYIDASIYDCIKAQAKMREITPQQLIVEHLKELYKQ